MSLKIYHTMQRNSSSKQNTTTSRPSYKCPLCQKVFHTSNALGGHQNAHRGLRGLSPILQAVLTNPIPLDDDNKQPASPQAGTGLTLGSEPGVQPGFNGQGSHKDHRNVRPVTEEYPEEFLTTDLLREWVPMNVETSFERTITDPIVRVSKGKVKGKGKAKGKVDIDLALKLGF